MPRKTSRARAKEFVLTERRVKLIDYRNEGRKYHEFYAELGYATPSHASKDFQRCLEHVIAEERHSLEVYRQAELMKLDTLSVAAMRVLNRKHYHVAPNGHIVEDPNGGPLVDDGPNLAAMDRLIRIGDRRAKLLGLDQPQRLEVLTIDAIDAEIQRLHSEIAALGTEAGQAPGVEAPQG